MPDHTLVIEVAGDLVGSVAVRPEENGSWLEHFYLSPSLQRQRIGSAVLERLLAEADDAGTTLRLNVLQGSRAQSLYLRHGFVVDRQDSIDVFMIRTSRGRTV